MSKRKKQATDGRLALVDLDDPTVSQAARVFHALGLRLELWTEPLPLVPDSVTADDEPAVDPIGQHVPALMSIANPRTWAVYCPGCASDAHPGIYPCRRDERLVIWDRVPPQLLTSNP